MMQIKKLLRKNEEAFLMSKDLKKQDLAVSLQQ